MAGLDDDEVMEKDQDDSAAEGHVTRQGHKEKPNIVEEPQSIFESQIVG